MPSGVSSTHCTRAAPGPHIGGNAGRIFQESAPDGKIVPIPPNQDTVNALFDAGVSSEEEMEAWLNQRRVVNEVRPLTSSSSRTLGWARRRLEWGVD